ncbi:MAG: S49 family peptidase [Gammaproteobacteria bacterium]|nr:S49 family peptidase [Gammaproteobacteria bacterium]
MSKQLFAMEPESLRSFIEHKNNLQEASLHAGPEKIQEIKAAVSNFNSDEKPRGYFVEDGVANIPIVGPLMPKRDLCSSLFDLDMTTYSDIINSIRLAENDASVDKIVFNVNSPGGSTVGLARTAEKIKSATKPTVAFITDMAASAAYFLASQANEIVSEHTMVNVGSIGVYLEVTNSTERDKAMGVVRKGIVSANAPRKNVDPFTAEGEQDVIEMITNMETVFFDYVASGRHTTVANIKENYGKGGMLIARDALSAGMIDAIETITTTDKDTSIQVKNNINPKTEDDLMDNENVTMSKEEFNSAINSAATTAVEKALTAQASKNEEKLVAEKAESERVAGFTGMLTSFPKQAEMIKAEIEKGGSATADFAMKVSAAETSRKETDAEVKKDDEAAVADVETKTEPVVGSKASAVAKMCVDGRV